jgi:hypothetical protein
MRQQFGAQVPEKGTIEKILCALLEAGLLTQSGQAR